MAIDRLSRLGLRNRMALSYLSTSVLVVLLAAGLDQTLVARLSVNGADRTARDAAQAIAQSISSSSSSPYRPRQRGVLVIPSDIEPRIDQPHLVLPHIYGQQSGPASAELVIDGSGRVVATSYPSRFPVSAELTSLVPAAGDQLPRALAGHAAHGEADTDGGRVAWYLEPVLAGTGPPTGVVYVQIGEPGTSAMSLAEGYSLTALAVTAALAPIGALFGMFTMLSTVRRIRGLVESSESLAAGDFAQRVQPRGCDEVTSLQRQFNLMAACLEVAVRRSRDLAADQARLAERGRIARELHDSISQELFALRMEVSGLEVVHAGDGELRRQLGDVGLALTGTIRQMRALLLELRPSVGPATDLPTALRELAAGYRSRVGLDVEVNVALEPGLVPDRVGHALLRITQESLANAARHSGADRVQVCLRRTAAGAELRIADNGCGLEHAALEERHGLGIRLLRERVADVGGALQIESAPGSGTCIAVTVAW